LRVRTEHKIWYNEQGRPEGLEDMVFTQSNSPTQVHYNTELATMPDSL